MKLKLGEDCYNNTGISGFYEFVAIKSGYTVTENTRFDCRKINVAKSIEDALFKYMEGHGYSQEGVCMAWCVYGPKLDETLEPGEVEIFEGFAFEEKADETVS